MMHDNGTDCVLVVDDGRLVGIFTDRDAVLKVAGRPLESRPIEELMTHDPVVLRHDDTIAVAINKMAVGGFRHIPIVEHGRPIGLVSARDVFRHLAESLGWKPGPDRMPVRVASLAERPDLVDPARFPVRAAGVDAAPVTTLAALDRRPSRGGMP